MTDGRWTLVWKLFSELQELPEPERGLALASSGWPADVREEVAALLEQSTSLSAGPPPPWAEPAVDFSPGTEFGRYVITGLIGHGGFGRVYAVHDRDLRRSAAIKVLSSRWDGHGAQLLEEARAASALNHPNILTIHDTIEIEGHPAMVMEFVPGHSLRQEVVQLKSTERGETALRLGRQIAQALDTAHRAGIVHRDVKPENILVRPDGYLKLVDFGLATAAVEGENPGRPFDGTLSYASPEQFAGAPPTAASDIFSFGIVLYEIATGTHPFRRPTQLATADAIAQQPVPPPSARNSAIPQQLDRLILDMLSKTPARRPSAAQVAARLTPVTAAPRRARWVPWLALLPLAAGLAALRYWPADPPAGSQEPLNILNATSMDGFESNPAFSPDGRQIAFAWDGGPSGQPGIYVKPLAGGSATPISRPRGGHDFFPAFSPDGRHLAFVRRIGKGPGLSVLTVPTAGGPEVKITGIADNHGYPFPVAWHPDGKSLLVRDIVREDKAQIMRVTLDGARSLVTTPPPTAWDSLPTPSPDGRRLAFVRNTKTVVAQICVQPMAGGSPRCFAPGPFRTGLAWSGDGQSLLVANEFRSLARIRLSDGQETKVADGAFRDLRGDRLGRQFAFTYLLRDYSIWRYDLGGGPPRKWIASSQHDEEPDYSPDGRSIAFRSTRSGNYDLWICERDGSAPRQITRHGGAAVGSPRWSPDGQQLAFWDSLPRDRFNRIYVAPATGGAARPVTPDTSNALYPVWSADGRWILFAGGQPAGIWRIPAQGGPAERLASGPWLDAFLSADGRWLYFTKDYETPGLWRLPTNGGQEPERVPGSLGIANYRYWHVLKDVAYYVDFQEPRSLRALHLATGQNRRLAALPDELSLGPRGLALSPDGKSLLITKLDVGVGDIRLIDNLR